MEQKKKILFIVSSTAQAEMVGILADCLKDKYNIKVINIQRWKHREDIERTIAKTGLSYFTIAFPFKTFIYRILQRESPSIIIVCHDWNIIDRFFITAASEMGIPSLLLQDGILAAARDRSAIEKHNQEVIKNYWRTLPKRLWRFLFKDRLSFRIKLEIALFEARYRSFGKKGIYGHGGCSKIAVFGPAVRDMLIIEGVAPDRIVVTGNPKFDRIYTTKQVNYKDKICETWHLSPRDKIVVLFTQYFVEEGQWTKEQRAHFVLAITRAVSMVQGAKLIIKLHPPYENEDDYRDIVKGFKVQPIICKYSPIHELASACDLAITVSSTAALETMAAGKPVVVVDLFQEGSFFAGSGALYVQREEDIPTAVEKALYDYRTREEVLSRQNEFVFRQAYLQDGCASNRIRDLIMEMVSTKK